MVRRFLVLLILVSFARLAVPPVTHADLCTACADPDEPEVVVALPQWR